MTSFEELPADPFGDTTSVQPPVVESLMGLVSICARHQDDLPAPVASALAHHTRAVIAHTRTPETFVITAEHLRSGVALLSSYAYGHDAGERFDDLANMAHQMVAEDTSETLASTIAAVCALSFLVAGLDSDRYIEQLRAFAANLG